MIDDKNYTEKLRDEIVLIAQKLAEAKEKEAKALKSIASDAKYSQLKKLKNKVALYAGEAELNFLEGRKLAVLAVTGDEPSTFDFGAMGTADAFPAALSFDGDIWEFYLPPTPSVKNGNIARHVGRWSGYLTQNLIRKHEEEHGKIKLLEHPVIVFEFGFSKDTPLTKLYDADNRDNKRIIDALSGHIIRDDNILEIDAIYTGVIGKENYTRVYVMEKSLFSSWYAENSNREKHPADNEKK